MDSTEYAAAVAANVDAAIRDGDKSVLSIAAKTGIPRTTLDRRLRSGGLSPFTVSEVKAIATALDITAASLLVVRIDTATAVA